MGTSEMVHSSQARKGMEEAKWAVWADPDWEGGVAHCLDRIPLDEVPVGGWVLDVGCGMGRLLKPIADRRPDANVMGYDPSEPMIKRCREYVGRTRNITASTTIPGGHFHLAYSVLVLQHLPWAEARRVVWTVREADVGVIQFVNTEQEPGEMSHPLEESVLFDHFSWNYHHVEVRTDEVYPTWSWIIGRRRRQA